MRKSGKMGLMAVCMLLLLCISAFPVRADIQPNKKIISVVYDDSGSMLTGANWASANYAMQSFAALLNDNDEMYITYMTDVYNGDERAVKLDLSDVSAAVEQIRTDVGEFSETPLKSVEVAMDQLKSIKESDENTQFWLVILTDGGMSPYDTDYLDLQEMLDDYVGTKMSNGSQVYINYMAIGDVAVEITEDPAKGLEQIKAGNDIVPSLSHIANKISGRLKAEGDDVTQIDGATVQVHSDLPLYTLSVFSQGSYAQVTDAKAGGEVNLNIKRNIQLKYPEIQGVETNTSLFGDAALINNGNQVIPAGDYVIHFSEEVSLDQIVFMYQPAIRMQAFLQKDGVAVDDPSTLGKDEEIDIEIRPVNPESGEVIEDAFLPEGISWKISYEIDGQEIKSAEGRQLTDVPVGEGENRIIGTMQIPDYAPESQTITFTPVDPTVYAIDTEQPDSVVYQRSKLGMRDGSQVVFRITGDGVPLTAEQLKEGKMKLSITDTSMEAPEKGSVFSFFGIMEADLGLKQQDDGSFVLYPRRGLFPALLIREGNYKATVTFSGDQNIQAEGVLTITGQASDIGGLIPIIIFLLFVLYLLYIFLVKAKFQGQTLKIDVFASAGSMGEGQKLNAQCTEVILKKYGADLLLPTKACTRTVDGIKFYSDRDGGVYIKKNAIMGYDAYGNAGSDPTTNFDNICEGLKPVRGQENKIPEVIFLGGGSFYLRQKRKLYRIKVR